MNVDLSVDPRMLLGIEPPALVPCLGAQVQPALVPALTAMAGAAKEQGFELALASGYRDFNRQLRIFNEKATGKRAVLDDQGLPLDINSLREEDLLHAILRWSALPGTSRHHWGCDVDIYDRGVCRDGYQLQLTVAECEGPMAEFYTWLAQYLARQSNFTRPYHEDLGGVSPEPWHLSYLPLSVHYEKSYSIAALTTLLQASDLALKPLVLSQLPLLLERYVVRGV